MTAPVSMANRIEELFASTPATNSDWLRLCVEQLHHKKIDSERAMYKQSVYLVTAWLAVYAIGAGLVTEGEVSVVKVQEIKKLLILAAPLLGFLSYALSSAVSLAFTLRDALGECYRRVLPKAFE